MRDTDPVAATEKWAPQLLEEVKGIGNGAGVDFNTIFMLQCIDEAGGTSPTLYLIWQRNAVR